MEKTSTLDDELRCSGLPWLIQAMRPLDGPFSASSRRADQSELLERVVPRPLESSRDAGLRRARFREPRLIDLSSATPSAPPLAFGL